MHYLDHVWLPAPWLPAPCVLLPLQTALVLLVLRRGGRGVESITCGGVGQAFTYFIYFFLPPRVLSLLFQQSLVDLWFKKARITVIFHQSIYQPLRPVEAIWRLMRDVFADFLSRHAVNVYLLRKQHILAACPVEIAHWNAKCLKVICVLRKREEQKKDANSPKKCN